MEFEHLVGRHRGMLGLMSFLPAAAGGAVTVYFSVLSEVVALGDAFPWLFWLYVPSALVCLSLMVFYGLLILRMPMGAGGKAGWLTLMVLLPPLAIPAFWACHVSHRPRAGGG